MSAASELVAWLGKASTAIYLATDAAVADDISPKLREAATLLSSQEAELARYRAALTECAAEWRSPPTTMGRAFEYVSEEFKRRMQVAADALAEGGNG